MGKRILDLIRSFAIAGTLFLLFGSAVLPAYADPWWSSEKEELKKEIVAGIQYRRVVYQSPRNEPVRAHIVSVTGIGAQYIFGVLGSFGALIPPTVFAKQSEALVVINGGYFSTRPNRAMGLVMAHSRVLYPPYAGGHDRGAVGFNTREILIDWIGPEDVQGNKIVTVKAGWSSCHAALGSGPILLKQGQTRVAADEEGFNINQRAPRTAIGKSSDNTAFLIVVDGRQPDWSEGVTLQELAEVFLSLNAVDAINLDGGGSSIMVIQNEIVSQPSDNSVPGTPGRERPVANVIALFSKEP